MFDVFISYSSKDISFVKNLSAMLNKYGYSVWWDYALLSGDSYHKEIANALNSSKCVIVVWSKNSIKSNWVLSEANQAYNKGIITPILIDDSIVPLPFDSIHTLSYCYSKDFHKLINSINKNINKKEELSTKEVTNNRGYIYNRFIMFIIIAIMLLLLIMSKDYLVIILKRSMLS